MPAFPHTHIISHRELIPKIPFHQTKMSNTLTCTHRPSAIFTHTPMKPLDTQKANSQNLHSPNKLAKHLLAHRSEAKYPHSHTPQSGLYKQSFQGFNDLICSKYWACACVMNFTLTCSHYWHHIGAWDPCHYRSHHNWPRYPTNRSKATKKTHEKIFKRGFVHPLCAS